MEELPDGGGDAGGIELIAAVIFLSGPGTDMVRSWVDKGMAFVETLGPLRARRSRR